MQPYIASPVPLQSCFNNVKLPLELISPFSSTDPRTKYFGLQFFTLFLYLSNLSKASLAHSALIPSIPSPQSLSFVHLSIYP